jgi:hypothetical protein
MKSLKYLLLGLVIFVMGCQQDLAPANFSAENESEELIVKQENKSLFLNLCGIYCPPCGGWGWTMFEELEEISSGDALPLMIYGLNSFNDPTSVLLSETATELEQNLPLISYPTFAANHEVKYSRNSGSVNIKEEKRLVLEAIDSHTKTPVIAGATVEYWLEDDELKFRHAMEVYTTADNGHYRLAIYLVEDAVKEYQAGHPDGNNTLHPLVLREGFHGAWGIPFEQTSTDKLAMLGTGSISLEDDWNRDKFSVYAVIYHSKRNLNPKRGDISFVNASLAGMRK